MYIKPKVCIENSNFDSVWWMAMKPKKLKIIEHFHRCETVGKLLVYNLKISIVFKASYLCKKRKWDKNIVPTISDKIKSK